MRILLLIDNLGSGGAQRQMVALSKLLKQKGNNVEFLVYGNADFFEKDVKNESIIIHKILAKNYLSRIFRVRHFIRKSNFDAVISFLDVPNFLNCFAAVGGKSWKVITNERSSKESTFLSKKGKVFGWFQRYSDAIIGNSYNAINMWKKYYPQYEDKLSVIYNPVMLPEITSEYKVRENGKTHIIIAASYQYLKNPIGLVKALALLTEEQRKKIKITWYGRKEVVQGDTRAFDEAYQIIRNNQSIENVISLHSETKNILNEMNKSDVVALFSELEGLPNAICEGMMIGKPILMSKVSDYKVLVDEENGLLCDWDDENTIKDVLIKISELSDNQLLNMGNKSKIRAEKLFSSTNITNQWAGKLR